MMLVYWRIYASLGLIELISYPHSLPVYKLPSTPNGYQATDTADTLGVKGNKKNDYGAGKYGVMRACRV